MSSARTSTFPIGSRVTIEQLTAEPYVVLAELRAHEPVSWLPALGGWLVTRRDLGLAAMRDAATFTVDDPRFTTAAVLGPSMLSLDGPEHERHRSPFARAFRPAMVRERFEEFVVEEAERLVARFAGSGRAELRTELAGPLAVNTIIRLLGLQDVTAEEVLEWYSSFSEAIVELTTSGALGDSTAAAAVGPTEGAVAEVYRRVAETVADGAGDTLLHEIAALGSLGPDELGSAAAVLMFGGIETSEGMTANVLWHLLTHPEALTEVRDDRSLVAAAIEESLRLEPAAAVIDRYTTTDVDIADVTIPEGDLVTISLLGSNRDPEIFPDPDRFDLHRSNASQHVTFVQGPHGCLGLHLARLETSAAINALFDLVPGLQLDPDSTTAPTGLIFRKPASVLARWSR